MNILEDIKKNIANIPLFSALMWYCHNDFAELKPQLCLAYGNGENPKKYGKQKDPDIPQNQRHWEREEVILLVAEYFRTKDLSVLERNASIELISRTLRSRAISRGEKISNTFRNTNGIKMQFGCIKSLDPEALASGHVGLSGASKMQKQIVEEYLSDQEAIMQEASLVLIKYQVNSEE